MIKDLPMSSLHESVGRIRCLSESLSKNGCIFALHAKPEKYNVLYDAGGDPDDISLITKASLDATTGELVLSDPDTQSIHIDGGDVQSIVELPKNTLLMHIHPTDLLIARDWKVTNKIVDPDSGNNDKYQLLPIIGYD